MVNGTALYLDEIGRQMAGRKVELIVEDDEGNPATALNKSRTGIRNQSRNTSRLRMRNHPAPIAMIMRTAMSVPARSHRPAAAATTGQTRYRRLARAAFAWFLGENSGGVPVYDPDTGVCRDGLHPHGVNLNAGAESTICYLLARLAISPRTLPISRLPGARRSVPASRAALRGEGAQEYPEPIWPPVPPSAASLRARPSRLQ